MKEVNPRQFRAGINHKGGFLCFIRKGMRRLSASIFVNQSFAPDSRTPFLIRVIWRVERPNNSAACCLVIDLSMKRLITVNVFNCF